MTRRGMSLMVRISLYLSILVAVVLSMAIIVIAFRLRGDIRSLVKEENTQIAQAKAAEIGKLLDLHFAELRVISLAGQVVGEDPAVAEPYVIGLTGKLSEDVNSTLIAYTDGQAAIAAGQYVDISDRPYFSAIFKDGVEKMISDPLISRVSKQPALILSRVAVGKNGRRWALVAFEVQLAKLANIASSIKIGKTGYGWLIDHSGMIIANPEQDLIMKLDLSDADTEGYRGLSALGAQMLSSPYGEGSFLDRNGVELRTYYAQVPSSPGWVLGISMDAKEVDSTVNGLVSLLVVILIIGVLLSVVMAVLLARSIVRPITLVMSAVGDIADGDLTMANTDQNSRLKLESRRDELGLLGSSIRNLSVSLGNMVGSIVVSAKEVSEGAEQLSSTAQALSQGSSEQAASIEELSSSVEELASTVRQNADNTKQADGLARRVSQNAESSGQAVAETVSSMKEIASRISIIEEIARNTNLLALNAAIEAARAGEAGKGFAVVASEVRKLAERSAVAAGEINELSVRSMAVAGEAGTKLESLVPDIRKTAELIQEIAAASMEQSSGADQIAKGVVQMDQVVQQNAASSEELASTAEELAGQSKSLVGTVGFFKRQRDELQEPDSDESVAAEPRRLPPAGKGDASIPRIPSSRSEASRKESAPRRNERTTALAAVGASAKDDDFEEF